MPSLILSFSVIPRLLRYALRLRARSHNFSGELCSAFLVFPTHFLLCPSLPSFQTFVGPVFSNIAPATLLSSISYYNKQQHSFNSFTVSKIYVYTMGYVFGSIRQLALASSGLLTIILVWVEPIIFL